jgi:3-oxoacyl-[acyl-carrier-protein] synthase-3
LADTIERLPVRLLGTGSAVPSRVMTNDDFAKYLDTSDEWIVERTGIRDRRVATDEETTAPLATAAGGAALAEAGVDPAEVDLVICATITPEVPFPATSCFVQRDLGLVNAAAFDISAACSGFIYALVIASKFLQGGVWKTALIIGVDCMSRVSDYQDRSTCILFGDGAGAAVLRRSAPGDGKGILHSRLYADGAGAEMLYVPAGGTRRPASAETVAAREHYMRMRGREIYKFAVSRMQEIIEQTLCEAGVRPEQVDLVIPHQSNLRIIESARDRIGWPPEKMLINIDRYGNTSAASVGIGLDEVRKAGRIGEGDLILLVAFGAGLTWASALWQL